MTIGSARGVGLRLTRLHLRGGMYALARAELETLAGADSLDRDAILDLAEVRWRTGDLAGAAAAADAWLEDDLAGVGAPSALAHAILAEAAAGRGRDDEAAEHVAAAGRGIGDRATLDAILAGIPARAAWPWAPAGTPAGSLAPEPGEPLIRPASPGPGGLGADPAALRPGPAAAPVVQVVAAAAELVAAGRSLLGTAPERAAILLALALRADRASAEAVLAALDAAAEDRQAAPAGEPAAVASVAEPVQVEEPAALAFVRAEALRAAGRHEEARIAYASAERLALAPATADTPRSPR